MLLPHFLLGYRTFFYVLENTYFTKMHIFPTVLIASRRIGHSLVKDFTNKLNEWPWQCVAIAFGCSSLILVETPL